MSRLSKVFVSRGAKCVEVALVDPSFEPAKYFPSTSNQNLEECVSSENINPTQEITLVKNASPERASVVDAPKPSFPVESADVEISEHTGAIAMIQDEGELSKQKKKLTRKRVRQPEKWKRNILKAARNSGKEYTTSSGRKQPRRIVLPANCKCPVLKCKEKINDEERNQICQRFWGLGNINDQRNYIAQHVQKQDVSRRRTSNSANHRNCTIKYFLTVGGEKINVCRHFFIKTLAISETMVKTVFKKITEKGIVEKDKRGTLPPPFVRPLEAKANIRAHINALPVVESHYCRSTSQRKYLPAGLSIKKLYLDYKEFCAEKNLQPEKLYMYRNIFNTEYNYGFHTPKKDQCDRCTTFNNMSDAEKLAESENHEQHMLRKEQARQHKQNDKEKAKQDITFSSWCFDMEKVLLTPNLKVGKLYYKRKLQVFNFTMYDMGSKDVICYMWCECDGKKGSSQTASCLWRFFNSLPEHVTEITLFSDTAGGQNRNQNVAMCCLLAIRCIPHLKTINQKFMESGHSEMECDSVHSSIENKTKEMPIYVPAGWYSAVRAARSSKPYKVEEMSWEDFLDFSALTEKVIKNKKKTTSGEEISWLHLKWIQYRKDEPNNLYVKYNLDGEDFKVIPIGGIRKSSRQSNRNSNVEHLQLKPLYNGPLSITENKKKDLISLCNSKAIKSNYHNFYQSLLIE